LLKGLLRLPPIDPNSPIKPRPLLEHGQMNSKLQTKLESTVRYLGVDAEDALSSSEATEI
jgi:hypothetical protein